MASTARFIGVLLLAMSFYGDIAAQAKCEHACWVKACHDVAKPYRVSCLKDQNRP